MRSLARVRDAVGPAAELGAARGANRDRDGAGQMVTVARLLGSRSYEAGALARSSEVIAVPSALEPAFPVTPAVRRVQRAASRQGGRDHVIADHLVRDVAAVSGECLPVRQVGANPIALHAFGRLLVAVAAIRRRATRESERGQRKYSNSHNRRFSACEFRAATERVTP